MLCFHTERICLLDQNNYYNPMFDMEKSCRMSSTEPFKGVKDLKLCFSYEPLQVNSTAAHADTVL